MTACRVLIDTEPATGVWNMAVDQLLLESAVESGLTSVRVYRWREPTVSLGHFQAAVTVASDPRLSKLPVVRRLSGGGAILHHHEITYSCTIPAGHPASRLPAKLYESAHAAIIDVLAEYRISARMRGVADAGDESAFLCFSRGDRRDVLLNGHKIVGSAQRRRRGAVLQHGSILLKASELAPEYPGLVELAGWSASSSELAGRIAVALAAQFGKSQSVADLSSSEQLRAREIELSAANRV